MQNTTVKYDANKLIVITNNIQLSPEGEVNSAGYTDNVRGHTSEHLFAPNEGYCFYNR